MKIDDQKFKRISTRIFFLFLFVFLVAYAKFMLAWVSHIEIQASIFFDYNRKSQEWYSFLTPAFFYIIQAILLVAGGFTCWILLNIFVEIGMPLLKGYELPFLIFISLFALGFLNSPYLIYNYVGVYSSIDYEGPRGNPETEEFPTVVFPKDNKSEIERKISRLENEEDGGDEVSTRKFLLLGTAKINGYYPYQHMQSGIINYIFSLLEAFFECFLIMLLYLFLPLVIYEIYLIKTKETFIEE